ncbi:transcription termination factor Rho [Aeromicrobium sp. CF3.5]|uniref:transcription termination factor Rho n=1 Tax=Aeromicrobium sp. CF3.5 TaxID=3373078 RepID=UPI003EE57626
MTDTPTTDNAAPATAAKPTRRTSGGLGGKVLAELQQIASELGIDGAGLRKGALIDAIKVARGDGPPDEAPATEQKPAEQPAAEQAPKQQARKQQSKKAAPSKTETTGDEGGASEKPAQNETAKNEPGKNESGKNEKDESAARSGGRRNQPKRDQAGQDDAARSEAPQAEGGKNDDGRNDGGGNDARQDDASRDDTKNEGGGNNRNRRNRNRQNDGGGNGGGNNNGTGNNNGGGRQQNNDQQNNDQQGGPDDDDANGRRRNRRGRNRNSRGMESEPTYSEDDVLVPAAGILDILDNYAFVRTTGYLPSDNDVYVSLSMVRKWNLRRGDAVTGQVRQPREGERKEKFNPMVKVESVNGMSLEDSSKRVEFSNLTPLHPTERLRLEGQAGGMTGRVVDLVAPLGKGQRGLIVSPPQSGKTMVMQQIARAITENNPECHLMVVLVDERPEEVTDFQRTVKGEVIASTFDRPASDHTTVAELAIERAKRLVELGHDVVVLLDGVTRLGRAYNLAASGAGRVTSGGVDSSALHPPKKFFGAARNIEDGGSLTILATAAVETGSSVDELIFEEFTGTGNWELRLRRELADRRIFPAVDLAASSTRREEELMDDAELAATWKLRREVAGVTAQEGLESVLGRLAKSSSNSEFLQKLT